jgi:hypothetical protein
MPVIWGHVQTVTLSVGTSQRIAVTTCAPGLKETIDAQVGRNTLIARGIHTVPLSDIKAGELVELSYVKIGDRVEACMVYLRAHEWLMRA